jgi:hypothetical protein
LAADAKPSLHWLSESFAGGRLFVVKKSKNAAMLVSLFVGLRLCSQSIEIKSREGRMALEAFYFDTYQVLDVVNGSPSYTDELDFPTWSGAVLATAPIAGFSHSEGIVSIVCAGIVDYVLEGQLHPIAVGSADPGGPFFDMPGAFWMPFPNVRGVTFALQLVDQGGGGFYATSGDAIFKVELWD